METEMKCSQMTILWNGVSDQKWSCSSLLEARDTKTMAMCNLIINKHENIYVGVYWYDVSVPGWKLPAWWNNIERLTEGETESSVKEVVLFSCFALCSLPLYNFLYGAATAFIFYFKFQAPMHDWLRVKNFLVISLLQICKSFVWNWLTWGCLLFLFGGWEIPGSH